MKITIETRGLKETLEALKELPLATARNVLERAMRTEADPIVADAAAKAPVGATGKLQDSVGIGKRLTRSQRAQNPKQSAVELYLGPGAHPKGQQQEFGNRNHAPQPFMRPAFDAQGATVADNIVATLWKEIKAAADRLARKALRAAAKKSSK